MSGDESNLARWARRKRAASAEARRRPKPKNTGGGVAPEPATASPPPGEAPSQFDPSSLPPIETIGAGSDIRPFLAAGVPAELTRAVLRRAWSADPAIRDFIGLSENSWDFNAPGGIPGFGSLTMEDAHRLLARELRAAEAVGPALPAAEPRPGSVADQVKLVRDSDADHRSPTPRAAKSDIAVQHERGGHESGSPSPRRRHGGALPD